MSEDIPIDRVCASLEKWYRVMSELSDEDFHRAQMNGALPTDTFRPQQIFAQMSLWMRKSNLLYRLIYLGEELRTEKCPKHDGHWLGCKWDFICDCQKVLVDGKVYYDSNVTGWLLPGNPEITGECGAITTADQPAKGYRKVCHALSGHATLMGVHEWGPWTHYQTGEIWKK